MRKTARALLEQAFTHDRAGREEAAIPLYRQALKDGLSPELRLEALICLASSYRIVGDLTAALHTIKQALRQSPYHRAARLFHYLILHDQGKKSEALRALAADYITTTLKDPTIQQFEAPLTRYYQALGRGKAKLTEEPEE